MKNCPAFIFDSYAFNKATGELSLLYALDGVAAFEEKVFFPTAGMRELSEQEAQALDRVFRLVFLLAGVSYYKAAIPPRLVCKAFPLDRRTADFCTQVYEGGLGEFAFRNKVKLDFAFDVQTEESEAPVRLSLPARALVPVGGGKDSIVTIETLKKAGRDIALFALGGGGELAQPIKDTIRVSGLPAIHVRRVISPELLRLNAEGALNGHVPITAILSSLTLVCCLLYGFDSVALSNERSASAPNLVQDGREINHQYSKSLGFERALRGYIAEVISPDLQYFSFLRPLSETAIAQRFASCTAYHEIFRSCNTAFRLDEARRGTHWCCDCPKCRFVFLALAPFMDKDKLVSLFGRNMLDDPAQAKGFQELCGLSDFKPFECVGEVEESAALMATLGQRKEWQVDAVVVALAPRLVEAMPDYAARFAKMMEPSPEHCLPPSMEELIHAAL